MDTPEPATKDVARYQAFLKHGTPGPHAYTVLLGLDYFDLPNVMKAVQKGFPWKTFARLAHNMNIPEEQIAEMIGVPRRTLARRKAEKRFQPDESDRLLRIARVFAKTLRLFDGDRDAATEWLTELNRALGNVAPLDFARTEVGAVEVEHLIGRIEHGIFS